MISLALGKVSVVVALVTVGLVLYAVVAAVIVGLVLYAVVAVVVVVGLVLYVVVAAVVVVGLVLYAVVSKRNIKQIYKKVAKGHREGNKNL